MRAFLDVLRFEVRLQSRSLLFYGVLLLFFVIHLLTMAQVGIHLTDNELVDFNSAYLIVRAELVLSAFGMLPAILFVVNAATRDHDRMTVELLYATPVAKTAFLLGRFSGGALCALLVGLAGVLGTLTGSFMPWLDQHRLAPFTWLPYALSFAAVVVPGLLVFCAFSFSVAIVSRSQALAFAVAPALAVLAVSVNNLGANGGRTWLTLLDPFAILPVEEASRYWSVAELNSRLPLALLPENRLVWLGLGLLALVFAGRHVRLELPVARRRVFGLRTHQYEARPNVEAVSCRGSVGWKSTLAQVTSQLRMDLRAVLLSPLSAVVLLLAVSGTISEFQGTRNAIMNLPLHPQTALMLGFFRYGLFQFVLMLLIFYSGTLIHREREHGLNEIIGASPYPDWLMVLSKTLTLWTAVCVLLLASMLCSIVSQALAGHDGFEFGVYLQGLFVYDGFYFCMLTVLAIVIQALGSGKWSGMVLVFCAYVALLSMESLGFDDLLYGFRIPYVVYSDMNGFGHFQVQTFSLIAYWSAFCVLLLVVAHLFFPRGYHARAIARAREAAARVSRRVAATALGATTVFAGVGVWIYYNTHVLNEYETTASRVQKSADYERRHGAYRNQPGPSLTGITLEADLFPEQRRLESRGQATLRNNRSEALTDFVVSADPRLAIKTLHVTGARVTEEDRAQGFYRFGLDTPLAPGDTTVMSWHMARLNRGFVNSGPDNEIVANGSFVDLRAVMPLPAYDEARELTDTSDRLRQGLPAAARLPALGDPAYLNTIGLGVDGRVDFRVVFSTAADQTAVAPGVLVREWKTDGRRYFEYVMDKPSWPGVSLSSARYTVARDTWNGVALEVYHDAKHPWNVATMLKTASRALAYFSREFAPYPYSFFRIVEFPRYRNSARAFPGTIPYSENVGFLTDLSGWASLDYATIHELAHQWWGGLAYGARMQGRQMLNETLAQYSTLMMFKEHEEPQWLRQILASTLDGYLNARSRETVAEQPLLRTEDQGYISYNKGALAMYALQDLIGADKMHLALRAYLDKFAMRPPPFPTSRDLVNELRAVAGPRYQALITDLFERIILYDVQVDSATVRATEGEYEVTAEITARQFEADGRGAETETPLSTWFDVVIFPESELDRMEQTPLYQAKHLLRSGTQRLSVRVRQKPGAVGVDPFHLMIDRTPRNNISILKVVSRT